MAIDRSAEPVPGARLARLCGHGHQEQPGKYEQAAGVPIEMQRVRQSIALLLQAHIDYEFRTTVVRVWWTSRTCAPLSSSSAGPGDTTCSASNPVRPLAIATPIRQPLN